MENRDKAVLTVEEVGSILRIGLNAAYELCRNNAPFRVVQIGNQYRISAESFFNWLNSAA
ncbi:MAG: helix-turn-helix domain-containing protein [Oscillospiraceae bacterium]|nr:helix-turn-helix domain-containing protein [Oscillospiraceae bacterium]